MFNLLSGCPDIKQQGVQLTASSYMVSLILFADLIGGFPADKYGRQLILITSLTLTTPLFLLFLISRGWVQTLFLALAGAWALFP